MIHWLRPLRLRIIQITYLAFSMKHYLTIIRKSEFTDLFKFGDQFINSDAVAEFDGNIVGLQDNEELRDKLFSKVNPFDYSFTLVIIHFQSSLDIPNKVNIEDVLHIYPLDHEAKREIEISFDTRIHIESPIWNKQVHNLQEHFLYENSKKGARNVWRSLHLEQNIDDVSSILTDSDIKELAHEAFCDLRPEGTLSFWVYLLRYERHGFFPKSSLGYFYDLVNIFVNFKSKKEQDPEIIETTGIYGLLEHLEVERVSEIFEYLYEQQIGKNFIEQVNDCSSIPNVSKIAILFLILKENFKDGLKLDSATNKILDYAKDLYPQEFIYAVYLIGIYLGHDHTFECMYEQLPLPIFKEKACVIDSPQSAINKDVSAPSSADSNNIQERPISKDNSHKPSIEPTLFDHDEAFNEEASAKVFPIKMRKKGKGGKARTVKTEKEYNNLIQQGYVEVKK